MYYLEELDNAIMKSEEPYSGIKDKNIDNIIKKENDQREKHGLPPNSANNVLVSYSIYLRDKFYLRDNLETFDKELKKTLDKIESIDTFDKAFYNYKELKKTLDNIESFLKIKYM